jgi:biotin-dependent carboxylase-like uncharacterized protein
VAALRVIRPGMLTTVQDLGRWGLQDRGVPVAGPMDRFSHRAANRLVGNGAREAALEITLIGPELEADGEVTCAVTGAEFAVEVDGRPVPPGQPFAVPAGGRIRFGNRGRGARASLAVAGGIDVEPVFDSRATSLSARMGGLDGRALKAGDRLPVGTPGSPPAARRFVPPLPAGRAVVRVMAGPHADRFGEAAFQALSAGRFAIAGDSNRMGYRLSGPAVLPLPGPGLLSDATPMGSLQVLPSGQLIVLMADCQTTGGYPRIATVIGADLPIAGQLAPGDEVAFSVCSREAAVAALRAQEAALEAIA